MTGSVEEYLNQHKDRHLNLLLDLLRIPSVSADSSHRQDMRKAADFVRSAMEKAGLTAQLHETAGFPIVTGCWREAGADAPTVLIYGHYDVQPPDPLNEWTSPPFAPEIRDGKIYARGATDDKGQMLTHLIAIEAWLKTTGSLPVNVIMVVEGEEEVGSNNLDLFLESKREEYACDIAVISDTSMYAQDMPAITYGLRGILACEVLLTGPNRDLHSGVFGGAVTNPINALVKMLASLHDEHGRVTVPGFYEAVVSLTDEERGQFAALPFSQEEFERDLQVKGTTGEYGFSTPERRWARPTLDLNGIKGGYQGEGPKTIVPSKASAKITCRLVPNQNPQQLTAALRQHLEAVCPPGVRMEFKDFHGCSGLVFNTSGPYFQAATSAIEKAFGRAPVFIREGGSIPVVASLKHIFNVETLLLGWGLNSDNLHSPNEHFHQRNFERGTLASAHLFSELAAMKTS